MQTPCTLIILGMLLYNVLVLLQHLKTLTGHTGGVWCSQFDGNTIVSGSTDRTLRVSYITIVVTHTYTPYSRNISQRESLPSPGSFVLQE